MLLGWGYWYLAQLIVLLQNYGPADREVTKGPGRSIVSSFPVSM